MRVSSSILFPRVKQLNACTKIFPNPSTPRPEGLYVIPYYLSSPVFSHSTHMVFSSLPVDTRFSKYIVHLMLHIPFSISIE
jgi:hypothetical protein